MINSTSLWSVKHKIKTDVVFIAAEMAIMFMFTMMNVFGFEILCGHFYLKWKHYLGIIIRSVVDRRILPATNCDICL